MDEDEDDAVVVHIFNGKVKHMSSVQNGSPRVLGTRLAEFVRSLSAEQVARMIDMLEKINWVSGSDSMPQALVDRYETFGLMNTEWCQDLHPGQIVHEWDCMNDLELWQADLLPHVLDGSLTHLVDDTDDFEKGLMTYKWMYRLDWDEKEVGVSGPGPDRWWMSFEEVSREWMEDCQRESKVFE